ncbi:MAG: GNAT family N-acetyltransferase, partial [Alphaproteobacteria bacterium]
LKAVNRSLKFGDFMEKHHPHEPHYYLFAIATTQAARGKGVGGALLKAGLARADADGIGCYLENSKEQNLGFYQAHGFEVMEKVHPVEGSPPLWRMWRKPH